MSMRYPGGLIATSPVNAAYPSGVWTPSQSIPYQQQNVWTRDQYWPYTTLLLNGNGTNGAQNNTFLDSSTNNFTITRNGNTTQGSFTPYEANGYWSNYFDGTSDYLTAASNAAFALAGDFTIECWAFPITQVQTYPTLIYFVTPDIALQYNTSGYANKFTFYIGGVYISPSSTQALNTWHHVAVVRSGSTVTLYINGTSVGTTTNSTSYGNTAVAIGGNDPTAGTIAYAGYISNARVVKGTAVYTGNFTPSTTPLTAITNTSLLTCQSNRFIDNSTNAFAITVNGNTAVQAFQPFPGATTWSGSVLGGSGYFDGTGDYLNGPSTGQFAPTGDFTISMWFYPTSFAASYYVLAGSWVSSGASDEWLIQYDNAGAIRFLTTTDSTFSATGVVKLNQWQFLTVSRSGSTVTGYINGTSFRSYTLTGTVGSATKTVYVGIQAGTTWPYVGWISDYRLVSGSAQSATPPTSPATAISGTNTLLNFTNAGIFDSAMMNDLETVGNAQVSTSVVKYGTGSLYFDGSGDEAKVTTPAADWKFLSDGNSDWTVEFWIYPTSTSEQTVIDTASANGNNPGFNIRLNETANTIQIDTFPTSGGSNYRLLSTVGALTYNTWNHVAVTYSVSAKLRSLYINGVLNKTLSTTGFNFSQSTPNSTLRISWTTVGFNGYLDDVRITKGVVRYISNFTSPPARLPAQ